IGAATLVATVTGTTWTDTGLAPGTHHYQVVARDAAGNTGPAAAAGADVPVPGGDAVNVNLSPTSDTYSNQGAPGSAYGTSTSLASRGSLSYASYLAFELPAAPEGLTLVAAHLQVRTTTAAYAGSLDEHQVSAITTPWAESTLTHAARPAVGAAIGTITGATDLSTAYLSSDLSAGLAPFLGAPATLTVSSLGADNLWFSSVDSGNPAFRPMLTLQFA
ncbi:DNRLRE domain-containing protein, partial [Cellulomonas sp. Sa3CUA2]